MHQKELAWIREGIVPVYLSTVITIHPERLDLLKKLIEKSRTSYKAILDTGDGSDPTTIGMEEELRFNKALHTTKAFLDILRNGATGI